MPNTCRNPAALHLKNNSCRLNNSYCNINIGRYMYTYSVCMYFRLAGTTLSRLYVCMYIPIL